MTAFVNIGFILSIFIVGALAAELPSFVQPCRRSQPDYSECTRHLVEHSVKLIASGAVTKGYDIPTIEPTLIDDINIGKTNNSQTWLTQSYRNIKIYGMANSMKMIKIDVDLDKKVIRYTSWNDRTDIFADYTLDGHLYLLELHNSGRVNMTFLNTTAVASIYFDVEERDGEKYIRGTKYVFDVLPAKATIDFENLFSGRKEFGKKMNQLISENWQSFGAEVKIAMQNRCAAVFLRIFNTLVHSVPAKKIFPD